jgi:3-hydroxyacyl-CoA dehydrogenase/enoyl-CoA hydratase/3-hydroxybutyryl-CoA epimerase
MAYFESETVRVDVAGEGVRVLWIDVPGKSVNVLSRQVMADLDAALERVAGDVTVKILIIEGAKPSGFLAGADLHEFTRIANTEEATALSARGQELFNKLERMAIPTMAVVHGPCLGGGLELALACDYRIAMDQSSTQFVFPEVELGLLPGWGGTQRAPRVVGLERALHMILSAKRLSAQDALRWGLVDAMAASKAKLLDVINAEAAKAIIRGKRHRGKLPLRTWRQRLLESNFVGRAGIFRAAERRLRKRVPDDMPAPAEALDAVRVGIKQGMEAGLLRERAGAGRLALTPACRNLVGLYFMREKARKLPAEPRDEPPIKRIGVVGAGVMGAGIAQLAAIKGCEVVVQEINTTALGTGMVRIKELFDQAIKRRVLNGPDAARKLNSVRGTTSFEGFATVDLVIEAAIEEQEAKRAIFKELERHTSPSAILATNTSSLPVASLQDGSAHPERIAGLHFFNPVHKMHLVEVVSAPGTQAEVSQRLAAWSAGLGKTPVLVKDGPGFVVNRILSPYLGEALLLAAQKMPIGKIDQAMRRFGMPMGPFELLDQIGLDVAAHVGRSLEALAKDRYAPLVFSPVQFFERMAQMGWLGQKTTTGFYRYFGKKKKVNSAAVSLLDEMGQAGLGSLPRGLPMAAQMHLARERMVLAMVNKAAACLRDGIAANAGDIDLAMILGTGWAPHRGGPLRYAEDRGLAKVAQALTELAQREGPRFAVCAELRERAERGEGFYPKTALTTPASLG